ncbi:MAG: ClpXP protease specificity-enhancing factor [Gammaproteobacteria bacterium]|nr:ClpXP protease specificity-enhancing factor [Gammaproteobacteria bacterium]
MTPTRPYLLRAFYEWILDNGMTPHILINAEAENVVVPQEQVQDGRIVFNIAPRATKDLRMGNDATEFLGRFGGEVVSIYLPTPSILAIYARENPEQTNFMFSPEDIENYQEATDQQEPTTPIKKPSPLKLVKRSK